MFFGKSNPNLKIGSVEEYQGRASVRRREVLTRKAEEGL